MVADTVEEWRNEMNGSGGGGSSVGKHSHSPSINSGDWLEWLEESPEDPFTDIPAEPKLINSGWYRPRRTKKIPASEGTTAVFIVQRQRNWICRVCNRSGSKCQWWSIWYVLAVLGEFRLYSYLMLLHSKQFGTVSFWYSFQSRSYRSVRVQLRVQPFKPTTGPFWPTWN